MYMYLFDLSFLLIFLQFQAIILNIQLYIEELINVSVDRGVTESVEQLHLQLILV